MPDCAPAKPATSKQDPRSRSVLTFAFALTLLACSDKPESSDAAGKPSASPLTHGASLTAIGPTEGELHILAWPGYIERGDNDASVDWVTGYELSTGCQVRITTAGSSDEMVSLMNRHRFDLVTASGDASLRLIASKKVQPINVQLLPSYKRIDPRLQHAPWHKVDGQHYGVPYQWGPNVLMYNSAVFTIAPTSWSVVFDEQTLPDGASNKGRVQAFDSPIHIADAALYLMHKQPALGIRDPYELTESQYQATLQLLRQQKRLIHRYWHDALVQIQDFREAGVVASGSWPFQVNALKAAGAPIAAVVPEEGATGWADSTMLHVDAEHPNCAYLWLEWSLNPAVQADVANWFGSLPAVPAACDNNTRLGQAGCTRNGYALFDQLRFWKTPVAACATQQGNCVPYARWSSDYTAIMSGR